MQAEAQHRHILRPRTTVKREKDTPQPRSVFRGYTPGPPTVVEILKPAMSERLYHRRILPHPPPIVK